MKQLQGLSQEVLPYVEGAVRVGRDGVDFVNKAERPGGLKD